MIHEDDSLFVKFFGDYPLIRVLDFMMEFRAYDYSKKEIAEGADISISTLNLFWKKLVDKKIVAVSRKIDKASLYTLNRDSPIAKDLLDVSKKLALTAIPSDDAPTRQQQKVAAV